MDNTYGYDSLDRLLIKVRKEYYLIMPNWVKYIDFSYCIQLQLFKELKISQESCPVVIKKLLPGRVFCLTR